MTTISTALDEMNAMVREDILRVIKRTPHRSMNDLLTSISPTSRLIPFYRDHIETMMDEGLIMQADDQMIIMTEKGMGATKHIPPHTPRAMQDQEACKAFVASMTKYLKHWSAEKNITKEDALLGLMRSVLNLIDGHDPNSPGFELRANPMDVDSDAHRREGRDWYEPGEQFNYCIDLRPIFDDMIKEGGVSDA